MLKEAAFRPVPVEWEKQIGVPRKWVIYFLGPLLLYAFYPEYGFSTRCSRCPAGMLIFGGLYGVYTLLVYWRGGWQPRAVWYAGLLVELSFLGVLVFHSGGLQSPLKLLYALTILGVVVSQPRLRDFLLAGLLAHISYTLALYFYYGSLAFYSTLIFWLICVTFGLFFLAAARVTMLMMQISQSIMAHPFSVAGGEGFRHLSVSIGAAAFPGDAVNSRELISRAENALFMARQTGSGGVQCYHSLLAELEAAGVEEGEKFWTTLETLITVINAKDKYTRGHSERVAEYVMQLGRRMNLPDAEVRLLGYAGFLHDIGKIEIDRGVLNKEGPLTPEEWEVIRKHPLYGATIVESLPKLQEIVPIIKHHHERYDGKGYPDGLKGEEIPLGARMLALADGYDAMHSHRPYRRALTTREALAELKRCAGTQFDPSLADLFIQAVLEEKREEDRYREQTGG